MAFPIDLTADIARERGLSIDHAGYEAAMEVQRKQSQAASKFGVDMSGGVRLEDKTDFLGYEATTDVGKVVALLKDGATVQALNAGEEGEVVLDRTPFYAESGGQVGDAGELGNVSAQIHGGRHAEARRRVFAHRQADRRARSRSATASPRMSMRARRKAIMANHSATHLLHAALRKVLGTHVQQKGSLVAPDRLRFDFSHFQADHARRAARRSSGS